MQSHIHKSSFSSYFSFERPLNSPVVRRPFPLLRPCFKGENSLCSFSVRSGFVRASFRFSRRSFGVQSDFFSRFARASTDFMQPVNRRFLPSRFDTQCPYCFGAAPRCQPSAKSPKLTNKRCHAAGTVTAYKTCDVQRSPCYLRTVGRQYHSTPSSSSTASASTVSSHPRSGSLPDGQSVP